MCERDWRMVFILLLEHTRRSRFQILRINPKENGFEEVEDRKNYPHDWKICRHENQDLPRDVEKFYFRQIVVLGWRNLWVFSDQAGDFYP